MKKRFLSAFAILSLVAGFTACNNTGENTTTKDSATITQDTSTPTSNATTVTSTNDYAAMADSVEKNSTQGYYLNPKTGKAYKSLKVDRTTGAISDEAGEPVWRYVDNRNWWVYGDNDYNDDMYNWSHVDDAHMENDKVMYKGDGDKWVSYDTKYKVSDDGMKQKWVEKNGDKIKIKTDEEGNTKLKVNDEKIKIDKDGEIKKKD